jgi:hypothetical protein
MLPILPTPDLNHTLLHLSAEEQADPVSVLSELCDEYSPGEARQMFDNMLHSALLDEHCNDPRERETQIFFGDLLRKALEACYLVCRNHTPT